MVAGGRAGRRGGRGGGCCSFLFWMLVARACFLFWRNHQAVHVGLEHFSERSASRGSPESREGMHSALGRSCQVAWRRSGRQGGRSASHRLARSGHHPSSSSGPSVGGKRYLGFTPCSCDDRQFLSVSGRHLSRERMGKNSVLLRVTESPWRGCEPWVSSILTNMSLWTHSPRWMDGSETRRCLRLLGGHWMAFLVSALPCDSI